MDGRREVSLLTARYASFPRTAVLSLVFAGLFLVAAVKLLATGHAEVALPPLLGVAAFLAWPALALALRGTLVLTPSTLHLVRRVGGRDILRSEIADVRPYGRRRRDNVGVEIVLGRGESIALARLEPKAIQTLLALHAKR